MTKIEVTKWKVMATAAAVAAIAICAEWVVGFRLGEEQGTLVEFLTTIGFAVSAWLLFTPLGRKRRWMAAGATFVVLFAVLFWNAHFTTMLDERFGGPYKWSGMRVFVGAFIVGPAVALITSVAVGFSAHFEILKWRKKPTFDDDPHPRRPFA